MIKMKKLLSLLGALGLFVTSSSSVISCSQNTKNVSDKQQSETENDENDSDKMPLRAAIANNNLGLIKIGSQPNYDSESQPDQKEFIETDWTFNLTPQILKRLVALNGQEAITFNPFDLVIAKPILINKFGDMKTTITVLDRSLTHTGSVDVYFSVIIGSKHLIRQTHLGIYGQDQWEELFDFDPHGKATMREVAIKEKIIAFNPHLAEPRYAEHLKVKSDSYTWDETHHRGSVDVYFDNYADTITVTYELIPLINLQDYNWNLGDIVVGSPNNPEIPNQLTDWHFTKAFYKANPQLVGIVHPSRLSFKPIDERRVEFSVTGFQGQITLYFTSHQVPQNVITDLKDIEFLYPKDSEGVREEHWQYNFSLITGWQEKNKKQLPKDFLESIKGTSIEKFDDRTATIFLEYYGELITYEVTFLLIPPRKI